MLNDDFNLNHPAVGIVKGLLQQEKPAMLEELREKIDWEHMFIPTCINMPDITGSTLNKDELERVLILCRMFDKQCTTIKQIMAKTEDQQLKAELKEYVLAIQFWGVVIFACYISQMKEVFENVRWQYE